MGNFETRPSKNSTIANATVAGVSKKQWAVMDECHPVTVASTRCAPTIRHTISLEYTVERTSAAAIQCFPDEVLLHILSFVPGADLIRSVSRVCKFWYALVNDDALWRTKCQAVGQMSPRLADLNVDYCLLYFSRPFGRNLIRNWNAADKLNLWTIVSNKGYQFEVEPDICSFSEPVSTIGLPDCRHCWVTSYDWCKKSQLVDLLAEGCTEEILDCLRPQIKISDWTAARHDCACKYVLEVSLLSADKAVLDSYTTEKIWPQWGDSSWNQIKHTFDSYPEGVRYIRLTHGGKDLQFWAGHYGPKITATSIVLTF